jgi:hypothetical protein
MDITTERPVVEVAAPATPSAAAADRHRDKVARIAE